MKSIGFKDWALVCQAVGNGDQCIILRKGGIAEGRDGFSFKHEEFFLFPTFFHEQLSQVRTSARSLPMKNDTVKIEYYVRVERVQRIDSLAIAEALAPLHILSAEVVRERFQYESSGIDVALVRAFALTRPWTFANEKRFGGCRSWIELPVASETELEPVLSEKEHADRRQRFEAMISRSALADDLK